MMNRTVWLFVALFWYFIWRVGGWEGVLYIVGTSLALVFALLAVRKVRKC